MPSVYDFHHIELDKVGRGKKRISVKSNDGGILNVLKTPPTTPNDSKNVSPVSSRPSSRRGSKVEDTKTRLFGPPEDTPRKIKNLFKSSIFVVDSPLVSTPKIISPKATSKYTPIRRNPITGEVGHYEVRSANSTRANSIGSSNGETSSIRSAGSPSIASSSLSIDSSCSLPSN